MNLEESKLKCLDSYCELAKILVPEDYVWSYDERKTFNKGYREIEKVFKEVNKSTEDLCQYQYRF